MERLPKIRPRTVLLATLGLMAINCSSTPRAAEPVPVVARYLDRVECRLGDDVRRLEVERKPVGCHLTYTKNDHRDRVAASEMGPQECVNAMAKIRKNLVTSGYVCEEMEVKPPSPATL